jgi:hypothetical protein
VIISIYDEIWVDFRFLSSRRKQHLLFTVLQQVPYEVKKKM